MNLFDKVADPRRRLIIEALTAGLICAGMPTRGAFGQTFSNQPAKLPTNQSIYRIIGTVTVNGTPATLQTIVRPGDTVETGEKSELVFVVGGHSMIVREQTRLVIETDKAAPSSLVLTGLRLLTGKLLTVSRNAPTRVTTQTATIGIRGTGWYAESEPDQTYFCTCYGETEITATDDPNSRETVTSKHHDRPLYILREGPEGQRIRSAPFLNHTDQEMMLIETLAGRMPLFMQQPPPKY